LDISTTLHSSLHSCHKQFGQSARFGGQFSESFGDMRTRALQLNALLAKDNLGLIKGAMSDKDLAFIEAMSGGVGSDIVISEKYAKERMESIQKILKERLDVVPKTPKGKGNMPDAQFVEQAL
jgi:hypothetical protein